MSDLVFAADIYAHLAKTNVTLQGKGTSLFVFAEMIRTTLDVISSLRVLETPFYQGYKAYTVYNFHSSFSIPREVIRSRISSPGALKALLEAKNWSAEDQAIALLILRAPERVRSYVSVVRTLTIGSLLARLRDILSSARLSATWPQWRISRLSLIALKAISLTLSVVLDISVNMPVEWKPS